MRNVKKRLGVWAIVVAVLLLVPLIAMQFNSEMVWTESDFVFAFVVLFGSALVYEFATRKMANAKHRFATGVVVLIALALAWVQAAVGIWS